MVAPRLTDELKRTIEALPPVESVDAIEIREKIIQSVSFHIGTLGAAEVHRMEILHAADLFEFYMNGLSEKSRRMFAPYPLFHTPPSSADQLSQRISDWEKENDWTALCLVANERIIGLSLLKRFWTEQVTSAIVIGDAYWKRGLGGVLQHLLVCQARFLGIQRFHVKVVSDNLASVRLHTRCGFIQTRVLAPPLYEDLLKYLSDLDRRSGVEPVKRRIIEMVIDLSR